MIPYILHVTVITTVCFLFYKFLLQKETFYLLNRWTLLGCLAVSFTLPLLPVPRDWSWRDHWTGKALLPVVEKAEPVRAEAARSAEKTEPAPTVGSLVEKVEPAPTVGSQPEKVEPARAMASRQVEKAGPVGGEASPVVEKAEYVDAGSAVNDKAGSAKKVTGAGAVKDVVAGTPANKTPSGALIGVVLQWLFYLYLCGVAVFGANFLLQMAILVYRSYARPVIRDGRFRIMEISGNRAPCSFGNTIFINPEKYDWETYNQILIHEKVHVSGLHTLDILLAEIAVVWQWFNPFVWLYRREVENNLEFLTDASVLQHREVERSAYQLSLLRVSAPHLPFSITNNYNQSLLKRRIVMMNSKRSSRVWKYFFLIPILTGLVCALNKPAAFGAATKNLPNGDVAGRQVTGEKAGPVSRLRTTALWMTAAAAFSDTGAKPKAGADSSRWGKDERRAGSGDAPDNRYIPGDGDAYSQAQILYMDQALQNVRIATDVLVAPKVALGDQMVKVAALAQLDMVREATAQAVQNNAYVQAYSSEAQAYIGVAPAIAADVRVEGIRSRSDTDVLDGAWFATSSSTDGKISFELKRESENGSWNNSFWVDKSEFNPFPGQGNVEFKLVREAGTMTFTGQFDGQEGFGHFHFMPDEAYFAALKQMGVEDMEGRRFAFFNLNIKKDYIRMALQHFPHLATRELIGLAAMHIDGDFIKYWQGAGIADWDNPHNLIALKSMHIDLAYIDELKAAGYDHLALRELLSLKSQHIDGAYIRELKAAGYDHLEVHDLVSLKSQHIDGGYIRSLGRTRDNEPIPVREIVSYKAMHIDSVYIASLRSAGYSGLSRNEILSLYSQHVTADIIKGFQDIGYKDLSVSELTNLKAMNITPEYVKGWRDLGYEDITVNQLSALKGMGVTPDFVREFRKIGFDHIPVNLLSMLKSTGVNADYVSKMKEKGFVSKDLGKYIRLKNDFE